MAQHVVHRSSDLDRTSRTDIALADHGGDCIGRRLSGFERSVQQRLEHGRIARPVMRGGASRRALSGIDRASQRRPSMCCLWTTEQSGQRLLAGHQTLGFGRERTACLHLRRALDHGLIDVTVEREQEQIPNLRLIRLPGPDFSQRRGCCLRPRRDAPRARPQTKPAQSDVRSSASPAIARIRSMLEARPPSPQSATRAGPRGAKPAPALLQRAAGEPATQPPSEAPARAQIRPRHDVIGAYVREPVIHILNAQPAARAMRTGMPSKSR